MKKACIFFAEGTEECEALMPLDILRRAGVEVTLASITQSLEITSSHGVQLRADALAESLTFEDFDLIILPGGLPGTKHLAQSPAVKQAVRIAAERPQMLLAAICAAPSILAQMGLLNGRKATIHRSFADCLCNAQDTNTPIAQDGNLITGWGLGAALPFSLRLVCCLCGEQKAADIAAAIGFTDNY